MPHQLDQQCIDTLRFLSVDAVQKANSGHPGMPMGAAPMAYVLWTQFLKCNPANPGWADRDRFVLSAGHGSSDAVLPPSVPARLAVELGVTQGWHRYVGDLGDVLGVERFGASAPADILLREYGFTIDDVVSRARVVAVDHIDEFAPGIGGTR